MLPAVPVHGRVVLARDGGRQGAGLLLLLLRRLDAAPCRIYVGSWADEILGRPAFPYVEAAAKLELVVASVSALGFGEAGASLKEIYARASRLGLALGPAEVGPALRLGYLDQPLGEFLRIAMKPVARYGGEPVDFTIGNGGAGLLLIGGDFRSDLVVSGATRFVFVRPRARKPSFQAQGPVGEVLARLRRDCVGAGSIRGF